MLKEVGFLNLRARHFPALILQRPQGFFFTLRALKENRLEPDYISHCLKNPSLLSEGLLRNPLKQIYSHGDTFRPAQIVYLKALPL